MKLLDSDKTLSLFPNDMQNLSRQCQDYAMNAQLFYTNTDQLSCHILTSSNRFVSYARWLSGMTVTSLAVFGFTCYYQHARLHRVWRIRNPKMLLRYRFVSWLSGGIFVSTVLFMISPLGPMQLRRMQMEKIKALDSLAVKVLELQQAFATLRVWYLCRASCAHNHFHFIESDREISAQLKGYLSVNEYVWKRAVIPQLASSLSKRQERTEKMSERRNIRITTFLSDPSDGSKCEEGGCTGKFVVGHTSQTSVLVRQRFLNELPLFFSSLASKKKELDANNMCSFSNHCITNDTHRNKNDAYDLLDCLENVSRTEDSIDTAKSVFSKSCDPRHQLEAKRVYNGTESDEELQKAFVVCHQAWEDLQNAFRHLYSEGE